MASSDERVPLRYGPSVAAAAVRLLSGLTDLARPGGPITLEPGPTGTLRVQPFDALTDAERAALVAHKADVLVMLAYIARDDFDAHLRA